MIDIENGMTCDAYAQITIRQKAHDLDSLVALDEGATTSTVNDAFPAGASRIDKPSLENDVRTAADWDISLRQVPPALCGSCRAGQQPRMG